MKMCSQFFNSKVRSDVMALNWLSSWSLAAIAWRRKNSFEFLFLCWRCFDCEHNFRTVFHVAPRTKKLTQTKNRQSIIHLHITNAYFLWRWYFFVAVVLKHSRQRSLYLNVLWVFLDTNSTLLLFYTIFLCYTLCYLYLKKTIHQTTTLHKNFKSMKW